MPLAALLRRDRHLIKLIDRDDLTSIAQVRPVVLIKSWGALEILFGRFPFAAFMVRGQLHRFPWDRKIFIADASGCASVAVVATTRTGIDFAAGVPLILSQYSSGSSGFNSG